MYNNNEKLYNQVYLEAKKQCAIKLPSAVDFIDTPWMVICLLLRPQFTISGSLGQHPKSWGHLL
jgi:hypothetical protein